jgi:hypothetical protein
MESSDRRTEPLSFLEFRDWERPDRVTPERVYATLDESLSKDRGHPVLSAVEAEWFDDQEILTPWVVRPTAVDLDRRVSVLGISPSAWARAARRSEYADWLQVTLINRPSDDVEHFVNLFAAPDPQALIAVDRVGDDLAERLRQAHSLQPLTPTDKQTIEALLKGVTADAAAVYDVGQGGCNALLEQSVPTLYFDFGGGCLWNGPTYPGSLRTFCFSQDPPIVLSHWDQDHWAAALIDTRAQSRPWIVPLQTLTLSSHQLSFLLRLMNQMPRRLHVWGPNLPRVVVGDVAIERATGASINDSGLALIWHEPGGGSGRMLFPADARYDHITSSSGTFTSLVVSHHGGHTGSTFVPPPDGSSHGRLAYSYGPNNSYKHPSQQEPQHSKVWGAGLRTETMRPGLGHIQLDWRSPPRPLAAPCRGRCQLTRTQT